MVVYAVAFGAMLALDNLEGMPDISLVAVWMLAPVIGVLVGRWWVVLAVLGPLVGRVIGWDPAENDGNPALWWPYVVTTIGFVGLPLLLGVGISAAQESIRHRRHA